jgi:hypothetical protein
MTNLPEHARLTNLAGRGWDFDNPPSDAALKGHSPAPPKTIFLQPLVSHT